MAVGTERKTADERRAEILEAARAEFADRGLDGASTDTIARRAGISQPYLFRLFGTKKELFVACDDEDVCSVVRRGFGELVQFVEAIPEVPQERIVGFFAHGMLLNVIASMSLLDAREPWAKRLLEACS